MDEQASGTIYVLRSNSDHPFVAAHREIVHKIGVTGGDLSARIANAKLDPTFLMAEVESVSTYKLYGIHRTKLEKLIHRVFDRARLDIEIKDRFGMPVIPREWFLVPVFVGGRSSRTHPGRDDTRIRVRHEDGESRSEGRGLAPP